MVGTSEAKRVLLIHSQRSQQLISCAKRGAGLRLACVWLVLVMFVHANIAPAEAHYHPFTGDLIEHIEQHHHEDIAQGLGQVSESGKLPGEAITVASSPDTREATQARHAGHWHAHIHEVFDAWQHDVLLYLALPVSILRTPAPSLLKSQGYRFGPLRPPSALLVATS